MKTNSKAVRNEIKKHILECVQDDNEGYYDNIVDACNRMYSEFNRVANCTYNIRRIPNNQERFSDYLRGLPFAFHYFNVDIKEYLNSLGINPANKEYSSDQMIRLYHYLIYSEMLKNKTLCKQSINKQKNN